jgi:hypothetical protein
VDYFQQRQASTGQDFGRVNHFFFGAREAIRVKDSSCRSALYTFFTGGSNRGQSTHLTSRKEGFLSLSLSLYIYINIFEERNERENSTICNKGLFLTVFLFSQRGKRKRKIGKEKSY